jgi:hypothetical protein
VGKPEGKRPLGRPRHILKMHHREIGLAGIDWFDLAQVGDSCEHGNEFSGSIKCLKILE